MVAADVLNEQLPFENKWNYFLDNGSWAENPEDYLTVMTKLCTVATIQQFWQYMNSMQQSMLKILSQASPVFSLRMFRSDVKPIWEDKRNVHGGKWILPLNNMSSEVFWSHFQELAMCVVGEAFCRKSTICGVVLSGRAGGRKQLELWTDSSPVEMEEEKKFLVKLLSVEALWFRPHDASLAKADSRAAEVRVAPTNRLNKIAESESEARWCRSRSSSLSSTSSLSPQNRIQNREFSLSPQTSAKTSPSSSTKTSPCISPLATQRHVSLKPQTQFSIRVL